jgi:hypothetical protein
MKNILSDIVMGGLFLLTLIAAHTAFSANALPIEHQKWIKKETPVTSTAADFPAQQNIRSNLKVSPVLKKDSAPSAENTVSSSNLISIKSYKQWKSDQVQAAIRRVVAAKIMAQKAPVPTAHQQLAIEELGLNAAKSLTLKDYIAMYLGTQPNRQMALVEGAKLLSPDEVQTVLEELAAPTRR